MVQGCTDQLINLPRVSDWPTPKDVAQWMGVEPATVIRMIKTGMLRGVDLSTGKTHSRWRIDPDSVKTLLTPKNQPIAVDDRNELNEHVEQLG